MKADTKAIHSGFKFDSATNSTAVPIYQTASYTYSTAKELADIFGGRAGGYIYSRIANPTTYALERRIADLEGGVGCIATSSGMGAICAVAMGLLKSGDEIVSAAGIFGGTISLFTRTLSRFGIETKLVDAAETEQFKDAVSDKTRLIFIETIGNPGMDVPDIPAIAKIARDANIPLVVDNTVTTPALVQPKEFGADIVVHSTTKYINGHGTAIGGAIVDCGTYKWSEGVFDDIKKLAERAGPFAFLGHLLSVVYRDIGVCAAPMNSFLMLQGLETLSVRMDKHCSNAAKLAGFLSSDKRVGWVNYPGLKDSEFCDRAKKLFGGRGGGLLTFGLGDKGRAFKFIDSLKLAHNAANLGDAKTLVIHPASTIFHEFSADEQAKMGVGEDMVRVSVGIEDFDDIRDDFKQAIEKAFQE